MCQSQPDQAPVTPPQQWACPHWCVAEHGVIAGEEDWVHVSKLVVVADEVMAVLCMSVNPSTGEEDGPYVIVGSREYSLAEAAQLGGSLIELAELGAATPPGAAGRRSRGP